MGPFIPSLIVTALLALPPMQQTECGYYAAPVLVEGEYADCIWLLEYIACDDGTIYFVDAENLGCESHPLKVALRSAGGDGSCGVNA